MRHVLLFATALLSLTFFFTSHAVAEADDAAADAREAYDALHAFLDTDAKRGPGWRRFLKSEQLAAEIEKGAAADREVVTKILAIYSGDTSGLEHPQFVAVREALSAWVEELSQLDLSDLPQAALDAKETYVAVSEAHVRQTREKLEAAVNHMDFWLQGGGQKKEKGWKKFLMWDDLQAELNGDDTPDLRVLQGVLAKYRSNTKGLELPEFTEVRDALTDYFNALYFTTIPNVDKQYAAQLDALSAELKKYQEAPTGDSASTIGQTLGWLESGGFVDKLVNKIRSTSAQPNLYAQVSADLVSIGFEDKVSETSGVNESILRAQVSGTAHMTGELSAKLTPNEDRAAIDIRLTGSIASNSTGRQGPVTVFTSATTSVDATKRFLLGPEGMELLPAVAYCQTYSSINGLNAPRILRGIAWNKARQTQPQATGIANSRAAWRVQQRMDEQAGELLGQADRDFQDKVRNPLARKGQLPKLLNFSTTADHLRVKMLQASLFQIGAPTAPPEVSGNHDLQFRVHESLVSNLSEAVIGGEKLTNKKLAKMIQDFGGEVPEELTQDPWSITFAAVRPISADFHDGKVTITIRGRRFTQGENAIPHAMYIRSTYKVELVDGQAKLTREGDVITQYMKAGNQSAKQIAFKTFARKKFESLFEEEIVPEGLTLPDRWEKAGTLILKHLNSNNGWIAAAWNLPAPEARTARVPETPAKE